MDVRRLSKHLPTIHATTFTEHLLYAGFVLHTTDSDRAESTLHA